MRRAHVLVVVMAILVGRTVYGWGGPIVSPPRVRSARELAAPPIMRPAPLRKNRNTIVLAWCGIHPLSYFPGCAMFQTNGFVMALYADGTASTLAGYRCNGTPVDDDWAPCFFTVEIE